MSEKVCVVTGGSSGIGYETAMALFNKGCKVYEFSRNDKGIKQLIHMSVDVTDENKVKNAIDEIINKEGKIDILVNCAGFGISGAVEFTTLEDAKRQFDVNFFGMVNVTKEVLKYMRERKEGKIFSISSVAAVTPIPFQTFYSASKAAINSYVCALANEVRPYNIKICAVEPGDISTGFTAARKKSLDGDKEYGGRISKSVSVMEHDELNGMPPSCIGKFIAKKAFSKNPKALYTVGFKYKLVCFLAKVLPVRFTNFVLGLIYG